ncbi:hypothetical protein [Streptomyces xantholiticus]|uniref:hypothetical protein n=1 Tax=Streptomyces xantholiticus TaxID=68285 RepID=UPI0016762955|nr:hypothetical protein [Streptomyces xantholiticus]GGW62210.1 hypothetical protein GCM10010381_54140 [Streptomyces xantholiticus]
MRADKLGSAARRALLNVGTAAEAAGPTSFRVLIRVKEEPGEEQRRQLTDAGAQVYMVAGDVLTASVAPGDLGRLTDLDCVDYVELSEPLHPETGARTQKQ